MRLATTHDTLCMGEFLLGDCSCDLIRAVRVDEQKRRTDDTLANVSMGYHLGRRDAAKAIKKVLRGKKKYRKSVIAAARGPKHGR